MKNSNAFIPLLSCCYALSPEVLLTGHHFPTKPNHFLGFPVSVNGPPGIIGTSQKCRSLLNISLSPLTLRILHQVLPALASKILMSTRRYTQLMDH